MPASAAPRLLLRSLLVALALVLFAHDASAARTLTCDALPRLMGTYLQNHVQYHALDLALRARVAESHLRSLDPGRYLFLEEDAQGIRKALDGFLASIGQGDCRLLESMQQLVLARIRDLEAFVTAYVGREDYAIDRTASLVLDPEARGFAKTAAEREDLYRRLVHFQMTNYVSSGTELAEAKQKLVHRYELMTKRAEEMTAEDVYARFLGAFSAALDPHSAYLSPDNLEDFQIHMALSLEGIGALLSSRDGYTVIEEVVPGGAADLSRQLAPRDKIIGVAQGDGEFVDVIDMELRDVVRMIRGKKGSVVRLAILRQGATTERFTVSLVRDKIDLDYQAAKLRVEAVESGGKAYKLAVIELPSFYGDKDPANRQASADVARLLEEVREAKVDGLLLDLSRNGGGLLEYAVEITGFFLESGGIVAVGNPRATTQVLDDPDASIRYGGPLVVLTSRVTASAGEILAGAIKDYRRGVIVGDDHTFGKGSVQTVAPLPPDLGALKMTTALFYRPAGASTQRTGVPADIVLPSLTATDDFGEGQQPYSLPPASIEPFLPRESPAVRGWVPVEDGTVRLLAERSATRIQASEDFAEIEKELAKARANDGVVRVADLLDGATNGAAKDGKPAAAGTPGALGAADPVAGAPAEPAAPKPSEEPEPSPQLAEALRILADLVSQQQVAMNR